MRSDGLADGTSDRSLPDLRTLRSLGEAVADILRERILGGDFARGEHLVETRLSSALGVSRGPIREALRILRAEGLVREEPRRGSFVIALNAPDVREIYEFRVAIEGEAARLVVARGDPDASQELQQLLHDMDKVARRRNLRAVSRADVEFHEAICRLSGNSRMHSAFLQHVRVLRTLFSLAKDLYDSPDFVIASHQALLDAIETGDPDFAAEQCREHVLRGKERVAKYIEQMFGSEMESSGPPSAESD